MLKHYSSVASYLNADYTGLISVGNAGPTINFEGVIGSPANPAECRRIGY